MNFDLKLFRFKCNEIGREFEPQTAQFSKTYNITCDQDADGNPVWSSNTFPPCNCKCFDFSSIQSIHIL